MKKTNEAKNAAGVKRTNTSTNTKKTGTASRKRRRSCLVPLKLAALSAGCLAAGAAALYTEVVTIAVARRKNKVMDLLASRALSDVSTEQQTTEESVRIMDSLPTEETSIVNRDGLTLKGHWLHTESPRRMLIMVHGWHGGWKSDFGVSAPFYRDCGSEVLYVEQRCHGESEGKLISYGIRERFDVLDWIEYARSVHPELPLYLCGISMGAATVLMCAGDPIADKVTAIIADCGYTSPSEIISSSISGLMGKVTDVTMAAVNLNCKLREGFDFDEYSTLIAMEKDTEIPVFFIHGDEDDFVPVRMSMENYMACCAPREILIVHGANHGTSYLVDTDTYQKRTLAFFDKWDDRLKG